MLLRQNLQYRATLDQRIPRPTVGAPFGQLTTLSPNGDRESLELAGKRTLLMYLSPNCTYCTEQSGKWRAVVDSLMQRTGASSVRVLAVANDVASRNEIASYLRDNHLGDIPLVVVDRTQLVSAKLSSTPTTILLSESSTIEGAWVGLWSDGMEAEVRDALGLEPSNSES